MPPYNFFATLLIAITPLLLWKKYVYRQRRLPPPRWTWIWMDLLKPSHLLSLGIYSFSNITLTYFFSTFWVPWTPRQDIYLSSLCTALLYQGAHILLGTDQPYFYFPPQRSLAKVSERFSHFVSQSIKSSIFFNAVYWCCLTWLTPLLQFGIPSVVLESTSLSLSLWNWLAYILSLWHLLTFIMIQFLNLNIWYFTEYIYDLIVTRRLTLTLDNSTLIHAMKRKDKLFLQYHAYYELLNIAMRNEHRRRSIYKEQPDHQTWTQIFRLSLFHLQDMDKQLESFFTPTSTPPAHVPTRLPPSTPSISSPPGKPLEKHGWASIYTFLVSLFTKPTVLPKPSLSKVPPLPSAPRDFVWSSSVSTSRPPAPPGTLKAMTSPASRPSTLFMTTHGHLVRQGFQGIRLSFLVSQYQLVSFSVYSLGLLFYHSKQEDPYGSVYPDLSVFLNSLLRVLNRIESVISSTSFLGWSKTTKAMLLKHHFKHLIPIVPSDRCEGPVPRIMYLYQHCIASLALLYHGFHEYIHTEVPLTKENKSFFSILLTNAEVVPLKN